MVKKLAKFIAIGVLIMSIGLFTGCTDYGYEFHFDVDGGNGEITLENEYFLKIVNLCNEGAGCELECADTSHIIMRLGGKKGYILTFVAVPDEGYRVKEWLFNGKIVEGNKTNSYTAKVTSAENYTGVIIVRFEPIPSN